MSARILGFAGHKQSGKSTSRNFLHGYQLRAYHIIDGFEMMPTGELVVDTVVVDSEGAESKSKGIIDPARQDIEFAEWAAYNMWPFIKNYSFASALKEISEGLFEIKPEQLHGTDAQKNTHTWFKWEDMPGVITQKSLLSKAGVKQLISDGVLQFHKPGKMTAREFLQFFGTDVCRKIYPEIWYARVMNDIAREGPLLAVIDDCRFPNEVDAVRQAGGKVIYLDRQPQADQHSSECALDDYEEFDAIIPNSNLGIHETNVAIINQLDEWGWLGKKITPPASGDEPEIVGGIHTIKEETV